MNAVNLLTMMFAAQEAVASNSQQRTSLPAEAGFFWQLQQQALADGGVLAGRSLTQQNAIPTEIPALLSAATLGSQAALVSDGAAPAYGESSVAGQPWSLSALLEALIGSLRQVLEGGAPGGELLTMPATQWSTATMADATIDASWTGGQATAAGIAGSNADWLSAAWNRTLALLNSRLTSQFLGAFKASSTSLDVSQPELARPAVPWSLILQVPAKLDQGTAVQLADAPVSYPLTADQELVAELPASVQWFRSLGLIGAPQVAQRGAAAPVPLSTSLELPDGSQAVVRLSQLAVAGQSPQQQSYAISIELPGEDAAVLTATLTIQRLAPQPLGSGPDLGAEFAGLKPVTVTDIGQAGTLIPTAPEAELLATQPVAAQVSLTGAVLDAQALPADQQVEDGYTVTDELLPGLKSMPVLHESVPAVPAEQSARQAGQRPNRTSWTVQMALDQLNGVRQDPTILELKHANTGRQVPMPLAAGEQLNVELAPAVAAPVGLDPTAPQLMEFVGSRFETAQSGGLEYLEMAERIMERVATARNAGNGLYNAHLDLNPPNLGKMFVNISVRGDAVALQIAVASTVPKEQLKDSLEALRKSLEDEGLYVVELQVHEVGGDEHNPGGQQQSSSDREDNGSQSGEPAVKTTPSINAALKSTPALGFDR